MVEGSQFCSWTLGGEINLASGLIECFYFYSCCLVQSPVYILLLFIRFDSHIAVLKLAIVCFCHVVVVTFIFMTVFVLFF